MPTQKKFFVLSVRTPKMMEDLCVVMAESAREIAEYTIVGKFEAIEKYKYYCGAITIATTYLKFLAEEGFVRYPKTLPSTDDGRPIKIYIAELPIIGRCERWDRKLNQFKQSVNSGRLISAGEDDFCLEIGTLMADPAIYCPDAYRLLVDDNYKEDKKDK